MIALCSVVVDPSCESTFDTVEDSNAPICANGVDDDGDGWVDGDDVECQMNATEGGLSSFLCNDGIDNDGDGYEDADDPDCEVSWDKDEAFAADSCDDGEDNDSDGWIDATDLDCTMYGRKLDLVLFCNDGLDNDEDGLIDANDMGVTMV